MARPRLPFRTDHPAVMRARERLADLIYPGGLERHHMATLGIDAAEVGPGGSALAGLARRTARIDPVLTLSGPLAADLTGRVSAEQRAAVLGRLDDEQRALWDGSPPEYQAVLAVTFGLHHGVPGIAEATGLTPAMPPVEVHAMAREARSTGGDLGYADAVDRLLADAGVPIGPGTRVLDFGCSSGRVVRVLHAAHPGAAFHGCDPNGEAIDWAATHLRGIEFVVSPQRPPLELDADSLDAAYAISIWSHFNAAPGLAWLAEMARVIRPGGVLIFSTHGFQSIALRAGRGEAASGGVVRAANDLYASGFSFYPLFDDGGDWGVVDPDWGMAFLTPEWLLPRIAADWELVAFRPAALEADQDLWTVRRR
jgi:SAM-dependent methyltransferase